MVGQYTDYITNGRPVYILIDHWWAIIMSFSIGSIKSFTFCYLKSSYILNNFSNKAIPAVIESSRDAKSEKFRDARFFLFTTSISVTTITEMSTTTSFTCKYYFPGKAEGGGEHWVVHYTSPQSFTLFLFVGFTTFRTLIEF